MASTDFPMDLSGDVDVDVTGEAWFENERNGSLDAQTFESIQKGLFEKDSLDYSDEMHSSELGDYLLTKDGLREGKSVIYCLEPFRCVVIHPDL